MDDLSTSLTKLDKPKGVLNCYWIISVPYYATYVFYGTQKEAREELDKKIYWEGHGWMWRADPDNPRDKTMVKTEIEAIWEDRAAGIKNLPFYPGKGWV